MTDSVDSETELEAQLSRVEDVLSSLQHSTGKIQQQLQLLARKQDDLEYWLHCSNLRFIGLCKDAKGLHHSTFLESLLIDSDGRDHFFSTFVV